MRRSKTALALLMAGLALVACKSRTDAGAPPCPKVAVLADASHLTVYRDGPGRDLTDVQFEADLGRISGECIYNRRSTNVKVDMKLVVSALRGPADRNRVASYAYFVAIVDNKGSVLARQEFTSQVQFPGDQSRVATLEELEQTIPIEKNQPGSDFDVYVGFKLTPEQVERNRKRSE